VGLPRRKFLRLAVGSAALPAVSRLAWAQTYPTRPVRIIVPAAAGGPTDIIARIIGQKLSETWGQQFVVENIPAGAGNVAAGMVAKAAPDGYTILFPNSGIVVNPSLYVKLPYDTVRDFAAVTLAAASPHVLTVNPQMPVKSVQQLISLGLDLTHVPFNGAAPAIMSTIGGHTQMMFGALPGAATSIKDGQVRALAVTSGKRNPSFSDVPTLAEAGVPDQQSEFIQGVFVPAGTSKEIIDKLYREIAHIVLLPEVKERLATLGYTPVGNTPEEFAVQIKQDIARWAKVIREADIK
jgi:tripartite-type tricarboxylate transporter receptor subunit TctC